MKNEHLGVAFAAAVAAMALLAAAPGARAAAQDKPTPVTGKLPARALCLVCSQQGEGEEKPAGAVLYKGKTYYFCNKKEVAEFIKDPEAFLPPVLPRPAPALHLKSVNGQTITLDDLKNKVVLLDFWATWCAPCVKVMPDLQKLHDKYNNKGFAVVGVSIDEDGMKAVGPFLAKRKFTYPMLLDQNETWQKFGVRAIPAMFLLDKKGRIVQQFTGTVDKSKVEKAVAAALAE
jgi:peroxiredoxin